MIGFHYDFTIDGLIAGYTPGVRYGLKNGRGDYAALSITGTAKANFVECAARVRDPANLDDALQSRLAKDPTWRIVRLLDHRWN